MRGFRFGSWLVVGCVALLCGLIFWSCDESDKDVTGPTFSVQFSGIDYDVMDLWVALHTLNGDRTLAVRKVGPSGLADFGEVQSSRVTCTIIQQSSNFVYIETYQDVPGGEWQARWNHVLDSLGTASLTFTYPPGHYAHLYYNSPGIGGGIYDIVPQTGPFYWQIPVYRLEQGGFSLFARLYGDTSSYCGWVIRDAFQAGTVNEYAIDVVHSVEYQTLTTSRPCYNASVAAFNSSIFASYSFGLEPDATQQSFRVPACGFPADAFDINLVSQFEGHTTVYDYVEPTLPASIDLPTTTFSATYNADLVQYENVTVNGTLDIYEARWLQSSPDYRVYWYVLADAQASTARRPLLPDSVTAELGFDPTALSAGLLWGFDYDTITGIDGAIQMYFHSDRPAIEEYHRLYRVSESTGGVPEVLEPEPANPYPLPGPRSHSPILP